MNTKVLLLLSNKAIQVSSSRCNLLVIVGDAVAQFRDLIRLCFDCCAQKFNACTNLAILRLYLQELVALTGYAACTAQIVAIPVRARRRNCEEEKMLSESLSKWDFLCVHCVKFASLNSLITCEDGDEV